MINDNIEDIDKAFKELQDSIKNPYDELSSEQYQQLAEDEYSYRLALINISNLDNSKKEHLRKLENIEYRKRIAESNFHKFVPKKKIEPIVDTEMEVWEF